MYTRPIFTIARLLCRPIFNYIGMPGNYIPIYNILWSSTAGLITTLGTGNTFRTLFRLSRVLRNPRAGETLLSDNFVRLILPTLNPTGNTNTNRIITESFLSNLTPHLPAINSNLHITIKILYFIMSTVSFLFVRPLVNLVFRSFFSLFFSATCILWSESLRAFKFLFNYALTVRDLFSPFISIPIPEIVKQNLPSVGISTIFLTGLSIITILIGVDLLSPVNFENFPIIGWFFHDIYSYFLIPIVCNLRTIYGYLEPLRNLYNRYIGYELFSAVINMFRRNR